MRYPGDVVDQNEVREVRTATQKVSGSIVEQARAELLTIERGHAIAFSPFALTMSNGIHALGLILADVCETGLPVGALAHHTIPLGWHQDRHAPPDTWNITIIFREYEPFDDLLVIDDGDVAWAIPDRGFVCFDNQQWHGITRFDPSAGYRIALTYYVPAP